MAVMFGNDLNINQYRLMNLADPGAATDAVTRAYVDDALAELAAGLTWRDTVRAASTTNIADLGAPGNIDGVALRDGDRVLIKNQTGGTGNGLYVAGAGGGLTRADDPLRAGTAVFVSEGTVNGNKTYALTTDDPITVGTTPLTWAVINQGVAGAFTAGQGIAVSADRVISVQNGPRATIDVTPAGIDVRVVEANGLAIGAGGLTMEPYTDGNGITVTGRAIAVDPGDSTTIDVTPTGIDVRVVEANGLAVGAAGITMEPYTDGDGITVTDRVITVDAGDSTTIDVTPTGIDVRVVEANGLAVGAAGITMEPYTAGDGVDVTGRLITVDPGDSTTIDVTPTGIDVRVVEANGLAVGAGGITMEPYTEGDGIAVTGRLITVDPGDSTTIDVTPTGIDVRVVQANGLAVGAGGITMEPYTAGDGIDVTGRLITVDAGDSTTIDVTGTGIDVRVNPNGGLVVDPTAGIGIAGSRGLPLDMFTDTIGNGTDTDLTVTHGFGTRNVMVEVIATGNGETVTAQVLRPDANNVTVRFGRPPATDEYTVMITGRPAAV